MDKGCTKGDVNKKLAFCGNSGKHLLPQIPLELKNLTLHPTIANSLLLSKKAISFSNLSGKEISSASIRAIYSPLAILKQ